MTPEASLVVVGASVAGVRVARSARERGWEGSITLLEASDEWPHDKPALSKTYLLEGGTNGDIRLESSANLEDLRVDFRPSVPALSLDPDTMSVTTAQDMLTFDHLVLATGCQARTLPFLRGMEGVHYLRTRRDAEQLRKDLLGSKRLVIIGGGFVGAEVASTARSLGLDVLILESSDFVLHRVLPREAANAIADIHVARGVSINYRAKVVGAEAGDAGQISHLYLDDGSTVSADVVLVGIGTTPNTGWLESSGLVLNDGVVCDSHLRASAPGIWAVGDVATWSNGRYARHMRMQHWTSAREQASVVAHNLTSGTAGFKSYSAVPYVWSDQYDARIQHVGFIGDEVRTHHTPAGGTVFVYSADDEITGATTINAQREMLKLRRLLAVPLAVNEYSPA